MLSVVFYKLIMVFSRLRVVFSRLSSGWCFMD